MYAIENIKFHIAEKINEVLAKNMVQASDLVYPPNSDQGDVSLPCFKFAQKTRQSPNEFIENLIKKINPDRIIESIKVAGPYLNFIVSREYLATEVIINIRELKDDYGKNQEGQNKKVMIEYSNVNTHKEYHIGHLRNICFGEAINKIMSFNGYRCLPVSYVNDFGIHAAKAIWWTFHPDNKYAREAIKKGTVKNYGYFLGEMYVESSRQIEKYKTAEQEIKFIMKKIESRQGKEYQLWKKTRGWSIKEFDRIYRDLGVKFKEKFYESDFIDKGRKMVDRLLKRGILIKSEGAVIADLKKYNLGVLVFLRSDGTATYPVADLPLAEEKIKKYHLDQSIYVVDKRQSLYFKQLFKVLELIGHKKGLIHLSYDFVKLPSGMMASRRGNVITYQELKNKMLAKIFRETKKRHPDWKDRKIREISEKIGIGAMKFEMLKVDADNIINFDIGKSLSLDGFTAAYIQYGYTRIQGIFKKINKPGKKINFKILAEGMEKKLLLKAAKYPEVLKRAGRNFNPSEIARYLFELTQNFNEYYHKFSLLKSERDKRIARLALLEAIAQIIKNGLEILNIDVINEM